MRVGVYLLSIVQVPPKAHPVTKPLALSQLSYNLHGKGDASERLE